jgi:hypothetical protein
MELKERMDQVAVKLMDGVGWGDLPWDADSTDALYARLAGQTDVVPEQARQDIILPLMQDLSIGSVNEEIRGAAEMLKVALNWDTSPEGPTFWEAVYNVLWKMERNLDGKDIDV